MRAVRLVATDSPRVSQYDAGARRPHRYLVPGGFEELFVKYRTDAPHADGPGFVADATVLFDSTFE